MLHRLSRSEGWICSYNRKDFQKLALGFLLVVVNYLEIRIYHVIAWFPFFLWLGWTL